MLVLYHFFEVYFEFQYMGLFRLSEKIGTLDQRSGRMQEMRVHRRTALRDERLLRPGGCPPELASIRLPPPPAAAASPGFILLSDPHLRPSALGRRWALNVAATKKPKQRLPAASVF